MKTKVAPMAAAILALATAATPLDAMPVPSAPALETASGAQPVLHRRGFYAVHGVWYYNGHRGLVVARPGYRYYRGYWFPAAHVAWCYETYWSYRAYDNTYQPYEGPRRQCCSPYI